MLRRVVLNVHGRSRPSQLSTRTSFYLMIIPHLAYSVCILTFLYLVFYIRTRLPLVKAGVEEGHHKRPWKIRAWSVQRQSKSLSPWLLLPHLTPAHIESIMSA